MNGLRAFLGLPYRAPQIEPSEPEPVSPASPAYALARSLTDPETRGEWKKDWLGSHTAYRNKKRDIELVVSLLDCGGRDILVPFALSPAERRIVREAINAFNERERSVAEAAALARLVADDPKPKDGAALPAAARNLANSIAACRDIPREDLLEHFTEIVAEGFDETEFAQAFATVHKVFHDWMAE